MSPLAAHFSGKTFWQRAEAFGSLLGGLCAVLVFLGGCTFGLIHALGGSVESPGEKITQIQAAQQADHAALIATSAKTQAHADSDERIASEKTLLEKLGNGMDSIRDDIATLKVDVASLKTGQEYLRQNQMRVMADLSDMRRREGGQVAGAP